MPRLGMPIPKAMTGLPRHLESFLGSIDRGWSDNGPIQIGRYRDQPVRGVDTFGTLGLSRKPLPMSKGREVRQEFLVSVYRRFDSDAIASFLLTFAEYVEAQATALLRGDVIGPSSSIIPHVKAEGIYAAMPVFFDDALATYATTSPPTVIVWLIPILRPEAFYVRSHGWQAFEELLEKVGVDFWDLNRAPLDACRA